MKGAINFILLILVILGIASMPVGAFLGVCAYRETGIFVEGLWTFVSIWSFGTLLGMLGWVGVVLFSD